MVEANFATWNWAGREIRIVGRGLSIRGPSCGVSGATVGRDLETGGPNLSYIERIVFERPGDLAAIGRIHAGVLNGIMYGQAQKEAGTRPSARQT